MSRRAACVALLPVLAGFACGSPQSQVEAERETDADARLVDVVDDNDAKLEEVAKAAAKPDVETGLPHFAGLTNESVPSFSARAEERLAVLDREHAALATRAHEDSPAADDLGDARAALDEARIDLEEVRTLAPGKLFDDGRLGVSFAINRAQRRLVAAREALPSPTI